MVQWPPIAEEFRFWSRLRDGRQNPVVINLVTIYVSGSIMQTLLLTPALAMCYTGAICLRINWRDRDLQLRMSRHFMNCKNLCAILCLSICCVGANANKFADRKSLENLVC